MTMRHTASLLSVLALTAVMTGHAVAQSADDLKNDEKTPGDVLVYGMGYSGNRYSPLTQINKENVKKLKMVWTRGMGPGIQEATPLVHNGVMYLPNPSDFIQAMDAATGEMKWEYKRAWPDDFLKFIPTAPSINRNLAIYGNNIIDTSADDFVFALDSVTGKLAWQNRIVDYREDPAQETSGPIIANGKVITNLMIASHQETPAGKSKPTLARAEQFAYADQTRTATYTTNAQLEGD